MIQKLREERHILQEQIKFLKSDQESENSSKSDLREVVQKLQADNSAMELDNLNMRHEVTVMKLEKEKMIFLLESKDKQLKAMRGEIDGIHSLVCSQLMDLKSEYTPSENSRTSTLITYLFLHDKNCNWYQKVIYVYDWNFIEIILKIIVYYFFWNGILGLESAWKPLSEKQNKKNNKNSPEYFTNKKDYLVTEDSATTIENGLSKKETNSTINSKVPFQDEFPQRDVPLQKVFFLEILGS